jgi:hypothetical protein
MFLIEMTDLRLLWGRRLVPNYNIKHLVKATLDSRYYITLLACDFHAFVELLCLGYEEGGCLVESQTCRNVYRPKVCMDKKLRLQSIKVQY